jgi:transposase
MSALIFTLRVLDHAHLLFLPPYAPALQPIERLCPLTNTARVNWRFSSIEELEDVQLACCATR